MTVNAAAKARLTTYLTGLAGFVGLALAGFGLADFDPATGVIDLAPFNAYTLIAAIPGALATIIAPVALLKGWGK
jgi:hypothetical protein